jgi:hypothetical protein
MCVCVRMSASVCMHTRPNWIHFRVFCVCMPIVLRVIDSCLRHLFGANTQLIQVMCLRCDFASKEVWDGPVEARLCKNCRMVKKGYWTCQGCNRVLPKSDFSVVLQKKSQQRQRGDRCNRCKLQSECALLEVSAKTKRQICKLQRP